MATLTFVTPIVFLVLPGLFRSLIGGPLITGDGSVWKAGGGLLALLFGLFLVFPKRLVPYLPKFLVRSRGFNFGLATFLVLLLTGWGWLFRLFLDSKEQDSSGNFLGFMLVSAGVVAAISVVVFAYSYVGLFQSYDKRNQKLRVAQLVLSLPAPLVTLVVVLFILWLNPPITN